MSLCWQNYLEVIIILDLVTVLVIWSEQKRLMCVCVLRSLVMCVVRARASAREVKYMRPRSAQLCEGTERASSPRMRSDMVGEMRSPKTVIRKVRSVVHGCGVGALRERFLVACALFRGVTV